jgi:PST family polysaccharide transporter
MGFQLVNYWARQGDDLLIGRFIGAAALGLYNRSYFLMLMPLSLFSRAISNVLFPALSTIQNNELAVSQLYRKSVRGVALISFPCMVGLAVVADDFVLALLGEDWRGMVPILHVFAGIGLIQSIGTLNGDIYQSQGRTDLQLKVGGTVGILAVLAAAAGVPWGLMGVVYAYSAFSVLAFWPSIHIATSLIGVKFFQIMKDLAGTFACAAIMGVLVFALGWLLPREWPHWLTLCTKIVIGAALYFALLHTFAVRGYVEVRTALVKHWRR